MSTRFNIPRRAILIDSIDAVIPQGPHAGQTIRFYRYEVPAGYADTGKQYLGFKVAGLTYRTEFRESGQAYEAPVLGSWSYSGRRLAEADTIWNSWKADTAEWASPII